MERKESMGMWRIIHRNYRRLVAFMLTLVMVCTNVGGNLSAVFGAGETGQGRGRDL